jgi:phenylacetate-CoA ligase
MLRGRLAIIGFDLVKGTRIGYYYKLFRSTLKWSSEQVRQFQEKRLREIIKYAYDYSPFYRQRFEESNITPDRIKTADDLIMIPPLTRIDLQEHFDDIRTRNESKIFLKSSSSGTTGIPVTYYSDKDSYSAGIAAGYFLWSMSGWEPGQRGIHIWGNPQSQKKWKTIGSKIKQKLFNIKYYPASDLNFSSRINEFVKLCNSLKPDYLDGYSQSLYSLAAFYKENELPAPEIKNIFGTAENIFDYQQEMIEKYLGPFSNMYGFGEINGIAIKPSGSEKFIIADPRIYMEEGHEHDIGMKEMIVTDLYNKIMPLIRYQPGDLFSGIKESHDEFPQFRSFERLIGRTANIIELGEGRMIHPVNLLGGTFFRKFLSLKKHKVIWDGRKMEFIFEVVQEADPEIIENKITEYLKDYHIPFSVTITDQILPDESGKYNYIENRAGRK